jgi:hypothetical protein
MYRLTIDIEADDYNFLMRIQQEIATGLSGLDSVARFYFDRIECIEDEERQNKSIKDTMAGVASPPPAPEYNGLTDLQRKAFSDILESENYVDEVKSELRKYILDWDNYKKTRKIDFIDEEEMKL